VRRRYVAAIVERADVDLSPGAAWLLVQIEREPSQCVLDLGRKGKADPVKLQESKADLLDKSLITSTATDDVYQLTKEGCDMLDRLVAARREASRSAGGGSSMPSPANSSR